MKKTKIFLALSIGLFALPLFSSAASFDYTPMEPIPGFSTSGDFQSYISAVYKFGIWTVGIAAMLMIMIGGYMYMMSAGNNASMQKAKGVITDAIVGLILALTSYLILYEINPNLVNINLGSIGGGSGSVGQQGTPGGNGNGSCSPALNGPCSVDNLKKTCFGSNAQAASIVCMQESSGRQDNPSTTDKCQPGNEVVSFGLFQINISANMVGSYNCPGAFSNAYTGSNHNCSVLDNTLYNECKSTATQPVSDNTSPNIARACALSNNGTDWSSAWGTTAQKCGL